MTARIANTGTGINQDELTVSLSIVPPLPVCVGDFNGDRTVDLIDLAIVLVNFGTNGGLSDGDANGDGLVDLTDLAVLLANFGNDC